MCCYTNPSLFIYQKRNFLFVDGVCAFATSSEGGLSKVYSFLMGLRDGTLQEKIAQEEVEKNQKSNAQNVLTKLFPNANSIQSASKNYVSASPTTNVTNSPLRAAAASEKPPNQGPKVRSQKNSKTPVQVPAKGLKITPNDLFSQKNGAKKKLPAPESTSMDNVISMLSEAVAATSTLDALADEEVSRISEAAHCLTPEEERSSSDLSGAYVDDSQTRVLDSFIHLLKLERVDSQTLHAAPSSRPQVTKLRESFGIVDSSLIPRDDLYRILLNSAFEEYKNQRFPHLYLFPGVDATSTLVAAANMIKVCSHNLFFLNLFILAKSRFRSHSQTLQSR